MVIRSRALTFLRGVVVTGLVFAAANVDAGAQTAPPPSPPADAPAPPPTEVERHAALGQRLLEQGRTQEAIAEFRRAYELRAEPRFLYDIAQSYRQLGLYDQARFFYERYLSAAPDAPDRDEVEAALAAVTQPARPAPHPPLAPSLAHDVILVPVAESPPPWRRWWVWAAFGALVAGGIATVLLTRDSDTQVPATALGDKRFY